MTRTARITLDPAAIKPSRAIKVAARSVPLLVLTDRALADLEAELGSCEVAARFLLTVTENTNRPIAVNAPTPTGSRTMFLAPRSWTPERLQGWVAGHHEQLEGMFGAATPVGEGDL